MSDMAMLRQRSSPRSHQPMFYDCWHLQIDRVAAHGGIYPSLGSWALLLIRIPEDRRVGRDHSIDAFHRFAGDTREYQTVSRRRFPALRYRPSVFAMPIELHHYRSNGEPKDQSAHGYEFVRQSLGRKQQRCRKFHFWRIPEP